jgi:putative endonuclease
VLFHSLYAICDELRHRARLRSGRVDAAWGRRAEDLAHRYLQAHGLTVIERNWIAPGGAHNELDLVAWDGDQLVFVEVKSRKNTEYASPERALDDEKRRRVCRAARQFLDKWRLRPEHARFDLVSVVFEPLMIQHTPDAWSWVDAA